MDGDLGEGGSWGTSGAVMHGWAGGTVRGAQAGLGWRERRVVSAFYMGCDQCQHVKCQIRPPTTKPGC